LIRCHLSRKIWPVQVEVRPMKKVYIVVRVIFLILLAGASGTAARARIYITHFPLTENPVSESNNWINGQTTGLDWADVSTTPGLAIGLESGFTGYDDATALLTGSWGSNQMATATVYTTNRMSGNVYEEVEIRLRSSLSAHNCTGYEVLFSLKPDSGCYVQIVRWNGPLGSFDYVNATGGSQFILQTGDMVSGSITSNTITAYINGTPVLQGTDTNYSSGNPGIGIFIQGATGINGDYGFTSYAATDEGGAPPLPNLALRGPGTNRTFILQFKGVPGTAYGFQSTTNLHPPNWQSLGSGTANGSGLIQFTNAPPPGAPRRFYRSVYP
jgi:hypothetical protein